MLLEIVSIEKKTYEKKLPSIKAHTETEVCGQLRISPRTLQTLRDRRLIGYSQINRRFYYKPEEVKKLIPLVGTLYPCGK